MERQEVVGTVTHLMAEPERERKCICCPEGRHRYGATFTFPDGTFSPFRHLDDVACGFAHFIQQHGMDGKRVRVTFEVVEEGQ